MGTTLLLALGCPADDAPPGTPGSTGQATASSSDADTSSGSGEIDPSSSTGETPPPGDSSDSGDDTTGDPPPSACAVVDIEGSCTEVTACPETSSPFQAECDGPPTQQCCVPVAPPCSVSGAPGLCMDVADCDGALQTTPGLCPGDATIQCCTDPATACDETAMPTPNEGLVEAPGDAGCPAGMLLSDGFCIDRHEAALVIVDDEGRQLGHHSPYFNPGDTRVRAVSLPGAIPQGYINQVQAAAACSEAGKRLCTNTEWLRACQGAANTTFPYGDRLVPGRCNDARAMHPAIEYFGTSEEWIWSELGHPCISQIPDSLHVTGRHADCVTSEGAFDMMGNLHEWTSDPEGTFRGGFFADTAINGPGCLYATTAHGVSHWDYSTGFRCCADPD
ncbi:MAG: SUMF1/EgtB/PvdO family nonheme iron enzyme [Myxococcota bacterium]